MVPAPPRTFVEGLRYCHNPLLVAHHFREVMRRQSFIAALTGAEAKEIRRVVAEIEQDADFHAQIMGKRQQVMGAAPHGTDWMYLVRAWGSQYFSFVMYYGIIRLRQPEVVVETGGTPGNSSAFILRAMERNGQGTLVTLDLPNLSLMKNITTPEEKVWYRNMPTNLPPGWIIPDDVRARHEQVLGDARETLPAVLVRCPSFDLFIHDSDHAVEHMTWEMTIAWPHIKPGGLLFVDDIDLHRAFYDFAGQLGVPSMAYDKFGAIHKPATSAP